MDTPPKENPDFFILPMPGENAAADAAVRKALQKRLDVNYDNVEAQAALADLSQRGQVNINPKWNAMEAAGIAKSAKVALRLTDVSLERALQTMLSNLAPSLDYVVNDGVLTISTKDDLEQQTAVRVYYVRPIVDAMWDSDRTMTVFVGDCVPPPDNSPPDAPPQTTEAGIKEKLTAFVRQSVDPDSWRPEGTVGRVDYQGDLMVVWQATNAHRKVQETLRMLMPPWAARVCATLHRPVKHIQFDDVPWPQAVRRCRRLRA